MNTSYIGKEVAMKRMLCSFGIMLGYALFTSFVMFVFSIIPWRLALVFGFVFGILLYSLLRASEDFPNE